ncbi:PASTA domain-containing protein [Tessaracoccus sp. MC1627]|uniref:Stk1 family PASTA domain-containing Ser/Thr kinase n=1 Tax=Tessaracoccus sp. MC1627 TaxID=2760312 RepID=UPI001602A932|nr:Stk1 family PASTA domain-containing Ser/Thr kinase [Tessaracoccus sp. MC1627]MBB1512611.1 PASTA domain-containing protein [Tessaracoccus sp. MC1627]
MNSTFDPLVGHVLDDRYEIVAKVARGGMATVYRARDLRLSRAVAVKVMRSDLGEDDEFAAKFDREARSAAVLSHPAVVSVFDQGTSQGQPYIVMEFIDGETLRRVISREAPLPPERALEIFEQVAAALAAAHEAGVVHRDIKPENVMITTRGQVKVADFGLARQVGSPQMTATGVLVGTASYLPPELVTHSRPDSRSDIYSAGVVLFEMLTGRKPHTGENNYQIAYRHVNVDIERPSDRLAETGHAADWQIPDYIDTIVLACVARDPRARIPDGRELLTAVRRVRHELARTGGSDNPALAAAILPASPAEDETVAGYPRTSERPRPVSPNSPETVVVRREGEQWRPQGGGVAGAGVAGAGVAGAGFAAGVSMPGSTAGPRTGAGAGSRAGSGAAGSRTGQSPVSPRPQPSSAPRSHRTPVFPQLHISHDPVHRRRRGVIAVLLVVMLTAGAGFGSWWWMAGRFTTVPAMTNLNAAKAGEAATANALEVSSSEAYSETVPAGLVISTDPTAGDRLLRGSTVSIVISKGPERYPMPEVVGAALEDAERAIVEGRMTVGTVTEAFSETAPVGQVLTASQEVGAQLKPGTEINLTVSKGPEPIAIPDTTGEVADDAVKRLEELGFKVKVQEENSPTVEAGRVIQQDVKSGNGKRGDTITITKSLGPVMVTIPEVRLKSTEEATKLLEDLDLKVEVRLSSDFPIALNIASGTDPAEGTSVPVGTTVVLFIA